MKKNAQLRGKKFPGGKKYHTLNEIMILLGNIFPLFVYKKNEKNIKKNKEKYVYF